MARMGQCFSTSLDAVGFATSEDTYHDEEDDVETDDRKYCFSDGVGKISEELAAEVWWIFILLRKKGRYSPLNTSPLKHKVVQWCKPLHVRRMEIAICDLPPRFDNPFYVLILGHLRVFNFSSYFLLVLILGLWQSVLRKALQYTLRVLEI